MKKTKLIFILSILFLVLQGCSENSIDENPVDVKEDLKNLSLGEGMLRLGEKVETRKTLVREGEVLIGAPTMVDNIEGVFIKKTRIYKSGLVYTEHLLFDPINSYLYPGLVFVGNSIATGEYIPVPNQKLNPITITTSLTPAFSTGESIAKRVDNMRYSKYIDVLKEWRILDVKASGASTEYEVLDFNSEKGFNGHLGVGFVEPNSGIRGQIDLDGEAMKKKNHVLVKFVQKLFSTSMDIPENGQILQEVNSKDLNYTMPVYISDIFYGRMAFAVISSDSNLAKLKAAINLSLLDPKAEISGEYSDVLEKSDVKAIFIGGTPTQHGYIVEEGWNGMKKFIAGDIEASSATPVSFILKYVDDNSIARVLTTEEFPVLESYFIPKSSAIGLTFRAVGLDAKSGIEKKIRAYGRSTLSLPENSPLSFRNDKKEFVLLDIDKKNYVEVNKSGAADFTKIEASSSDVECMIIRPAGMSMKEFLEQKVRITTEFNKTDAYGNISGGSLGNSSLEISLKDLVFFAKHNVLDIDLKAKRLIENSATLRFRLNYETLE